MLPLSSSFLILLLIAPAMSSMILSSGSLLRWLEPSWIERKDTAPPKSVSTTMFSKSIRFLADCLASLCFFAIRIILRVYQMHQITIRNSSNDSSNPLRMPVLEKRDRAKTRLHTTTTMPSKMFQHRNLPVAWFLAYLLQPTRRILNTKSMQMDKLSMSSIIINSGLSAT